MSWATRMLALALCILSVADGACGPEAARTRGGGPGADPGNRTLGPSVELHSETNPAYKTPALGKATNAVTRAPAESQQTPEAGTGVEKSKTIPGTGIEGPRT
jgi:hypothetical protein